ncbi:family 16 glycosylhydrolase [Paraglaciecola sp. L3A3]|uniref:glycoside hydrolase family 16 protein n=1 Tax=Paraglaciecola sp. L3A3 TaxID=2686358 RepID=UPI00131AC2D6|nr:family 16 glycosylhydrolase [Paraglaciecola sp. L3A3]
MKKLIIGCLSAAVIIGCGSTKNESQVALVDLQPNVVSDKFQPSNWQLAWHDEFDYVGESGGKELDKRWDAHHGPSHHILSSRWRENVEVNDGALYLVNRKEKRAGQDWTSGSIRTKEQFSYGYYEARYKYAASNGTNNSFWLMSYPLGTQPPKGKLFEIDINEGHYPNEVNTNIHNWSDITVNEQGKNTHPSDSRTSTYGAKHKYNYPLEIPVTTTKVRFSSNNFRPFHIRDFNVFGSDPSATGTSNLSQSQDLKLTGSKLNNLANLLDNNIGSSWVAQAEGEKWFELEWEKPKTISEIEFINGWLYKGKSWSGLITDFKVQYETQEGWRDIATLDVKKSINFAEQYHTYGLEWNEDELIFYFDGEEIRREKNDIAHSLTPIWLSLAIIKWDGPVTDKIDGTSMKVDYVRYFKAKP